MPRLLRTLNRLVDAARAGGIDAAVLIDFWGFNARLGRRLARLGIPVVYYVSPQIWAWRPGRLRTMKEIASRVLVIFPFEEQLYRDGGVPVSFVGHPLIDLAAPSRSRAEFLEATGLSPARRTVALLPGSRTGEVRRILPGLLGAADLIADAVPDVQFVIARAPGVDAALFAPAAGRVAVVGGDADTVLASADLVLTASGTATVQAALHDTPMVVVYRLPALDYQLGRRLVKIDTFAMVNLIAGERLVPELIQDAFTPAAVAAEAIAILTDADRAARMRAGLAAVRQKLGGPGASARAAEVILQIAGVAGGAAGGR
jgi:lipid-A-disaccharide synthase